MKHEFSSVKGRNIASPLCGVSGERHREVETQSDLPTAVISELMELFVGFGTVPLASPHSM